MLPYGVFYEPLPLALQGTQKKGRSQATPLLISCGRYSLAAVPHTVRRDGVILAGFVGAVGGQGACGDGSRKNGGRNNEKGDEL